MLLGVEIESPCGDGWDLDALCRSAPELLFFASPKKSNQKKGDPEERQR
jgi:hypothetical protein